jgi:predicted glutamine amidotransferase
MRKIYILLGLALPLLFAWIVDGTELGKISPEDINPYKNAAVSVETFCNADSTWGFDIFLDGKLFIHQEIIASGSSEGFQTEQEAVKSAGAVILKIRSNSIPHTLSPHELDSLGINY